MNLINRLLVLLRPYAPKKFYNSGLRFYYNVWRNRKKYFITSHMRPKAAAGINTWPDAVKTSPTYAVIIQGPLLKEDDFTLETLRLYKKNFPTAHIIISTWNTEESVYIEKIKEENIEVILNPEPEISGPSHVNYQLRSTSAAVKRALELGAEYILKTRTDQRIYGVNVFEYFYNIIKAFPPQTGYKQKQRIIGISLNTFKYRLYDLSDMVVFGCAEDMSLYWGAPLDDRNYQEDPKLTQGEFSRLRICEMYLTTEFLKNIGHELKWTLADSWQTMADHFVVVDHTSVDLYWHKYKKEKEFRYLKYSAIFNNREMSFAEWFNIYQGLANKASIPEYALNLKFGDIVPPEQNSDIK